MFHCTQRAIVNILQGGNMAKTKRSKKWLRQKHEKLPRQNAKAWSLTAFKTTLPNSYQVYWYPSGSVVVVCCFSTIFVRLSWHPFSCFFTAGQRPKVPTCIISCGFAQNWLFVVAEELAKQNDYQRAWLHKESSKGHNQVALILHRFNAITRTNPNVRCQTNTQN